MPQEYRYMGLHLVHLSFSTVMDNGHSKQDTVPSTTPRNRIWEILSSIIRTDNQMSVNKWHWVLGKMLSISVDLPVSWILMIQTEESFHHIKGNRINLSKGVHQAPERYLLVVAGPGKAPHLFIQTCAVTAYPVKIPRWIHIHVCAGNPTWPHHSTPNPLTTAGRCEADIWSIGGAPCYLTGIIPNWYFCVTGVLETPIIPGPKQWHRTNGQRVTSLMHIPVQWHLGEYHTITDRKSD